MYRQQKELVTRTGAGLLGVGWGEGVPLAGHRRAVGSGQHLARAVVGRGGDSSLCCSPVVAVTFPKLGDLCMKSRTG